MTFISRGGKWVEIWEDGVVDCCGCDGAVVVVDCCDDFDFVCFCLVVFDLIGDDAIVGSDIFSNDSN